MRDIELVIELNEKESRNFIEEYLNPKPNPARDKMIEEVRRIYTEKPRRGEMLISDRIRKLMEIQIVLEYSNDTTTERFKDLLKERNELIRGFPRYLD